MYNKKTFSDIDGVKIIADDILIGAQMHDNEEHEGILLKVIERAHGKNGKFSADKIQFKIHILGVVKYLAKYITNESDITAPLRAILKHDIEWKRHPCHDKAMETIYTAKVLTWVHQSLDFIMSAR